MENLSKNTINNKKIIPIFYACDDNFVKYTIVSINSLILNASKDYFYKIYILNSGISEEMKTQVNNLQYDNLSVEFICVKEQLEKISANLPIRDYYSKTTYFRMFIAKMFLEYDKAIYIDSDTVVLGDVSKLYNENVKDYYVGACHEQVMIQTEVFGNYVEKVMGIDRNNFFNAGVLLINCKAFRKNNLLEKFIDLLSVYTFVVTQDEDYLNCLCHNKVKWLDDGWNTTVYGNIKPKKEEYKIIHYIMTSKPWHYEDCRLKEYFWNYARKTSVYNEILQDFNSYTEEQKQKDKISAERLVSLANLESNREDRYINVINKKSVDRLKVLQKIKDFEKAGKFDVDVEDDPITIPLLPNKVDYLAEKPSTRFFQKIANKKAKQYYEDLIKKGTFVIKGVNGLENYRLVNGGAIITCNHFSAFDNYVVYRAIKDDLGKGKYLYKVIREGNYTNFKGIYGFFFKYCNTLPLSSNVDTMKKFLKAVSTLLNRGEKILIYPEQAMWWNYRKPRPLKPGAYKFAVKNNVPIIPSFITMEDTDKLDSNGFKIQAHTIWFLPPIYPKSNLTEKENIEYLKNENYNAWKNLYEQVYGEKLEYARG